MRKRSKLLLTALIAVFAFSLAAGTATANRGASVTTGEGGQRILVIVPRLVFGGGFGNITCSVTLHGSLHRTITKVEGTLAGMIESVLIDIRNCTESFGVENITDVRVLTLPWHVRYVSFTGTLPTIRTARSIQLGTSFLIDFGIFGGDARCLYISNQGMEATYDARGVATSINAIREAALPPVRPPSTANCPEGSFSGSGTVTDSTGGTVTVRLI